ncbi:hypothetical protein [Natronococcus amylolyticus]|uniref:hypothetical protein n=1 Tax=Natronococcus amylolyticus TaxID=44470 RepID=UPI00146135CF|nr:hypothetical protein [Natronococcus amylolyticus]
MSSLDAGGPPQPDSEDAWKTLAEKRDVLKMCIEEDVPFAEDAEVLLEKLDEEGY